MFICIHVTADKYVKGLVNTRKLFFNIKPDYICIVKLYMFLLKQNNRNSNKKKKLFSCIQ